MILYYVFRVFSRTVSCSRHPCFSVRCRRRRDVCPVSNLPTPFPCAVRVVRPFCRTDGLPTSVWHLVLPLHRWVYPPGVASVRLDLPGPAIAPASVSTFPAPFNGSGLDSPQSSYRSPRGSPTSLFETSYRHSMSFSRYARSLRGSVSAAGRPHRPTPRRHSILLQSPTLGCKGLLLYSPFLLSSTPAVSKWVHFYTLSTKFDTSPYWTRRTQA